MSFAHKETDMVANTVTEYEAKAREFAAYWKGKREALDQLIPSMNDLRKVAADSEKFFAGLAEKAKIESALNVAPGHPGTERIMAAVEGGAA